MKRPILLAALLASCAAAPADLPSEVVKKYPHLKHADFHTGRYKMKTSRPEQVHIAYAGQNAAGYPSGMNVGWTYDTETSCVVHYGTDAKKIQTSAPGASKTYIKDGGYHYNVDIVELTPLAKYFYQVECDATFSDNFTFTTAANAKTLPGPFHMNVFGDMGYLGSAERPVKDVPGLKKHWSAVPSRTTQQKKFEAGETDMMWIVGDIGYADDAFGGNVVGGLYEKCFNGYMNWMENITANVPLMTLPGNHESECHSPECIVDRDMGESLKNFSAYNARFNMPSKVSGGVSSMWYSFNVGPVHFVSINTETDFVGAAEEFRGDGEAFPAGGFGAFGEYTKWLEADLKQALADKRAGKYNFIVVGGHRPCCHPAELHTFFNDYEVDLYVSGHVHSYARSYEKCEKPACHSDKKSTYPTTHVYAGGAGNDETDIITTGPVANGTAEVYKTGELSTAWLTIENDTALHWRLISSNGDNRVLDDWWVNARNITN